MARTWQQGAAFAAGLALGAAAVAWAMTAGRDSIEPPSSSSPGSSLSRQEPLPPAPDTRVAGAGANTSCSFAPAVASSGDGDGVATLPASVEGRTAAEASRLLVTGKEVAAAGLLRDAEVAFLTACRIAEALEDPAALAEAKYHLARHYRVVATSDTPGRNSDTLLRRATGLYTDAVGVFRLRHGADHEKTRYAQEGLAQVQQAGRRPSPALAASGATPSASQRNQARQADAQPRSASPQQQVAAADEPRPEAEPEEEQESRAEAARREADERRARREQEEADERRAREARQADAERRAREEQHAADERRARQERQAAAERAWRRDDDNVDRTLAAAAPLSVERRREMAAVPPPVREAAGADAARVQPSFDCSKARSPTERLICADAELARLDRELGRLHSQARANAEDPRAFRRESDREWAEREATCRDSDCLRRWYAERRQELTAGLDGGTRTE